MLPRNRQDHGESRLPELRKMLDSYAEDQGFSYAKGEAMYTQNVGLRHYRKGEYLEALTLFEEVAAMWANLNDEVAQANLLGYMGSCYNYLGDYGNALDIYQNQLELGRRLELADAIAFGHLGLAIVYSRLGEHEKSCEQGWSAIQFAREDGNFIRLVNGLFFQVKTLIKLARLEEAHHVAVEAMRLAEESVPGLEGEARSARFLVAFAQNDMEEAERLARQNLDRFESLGKDARLWALIDLGRVLVHTDRPKEAIPHLEKLQNLLKESPHPPTLLNLLETFIVAYEKLKDWQKIIQYQAILLKEKEADFRSRSDQQVRYLETAFRTKSAKKEAEIAHAASQKLSEKNQLLEQALKEKNDLFHLVTHDLRNPLTSIQLIVSLVKRKQSLNPNAPLSPQYIENIEKSVSDMIRQVESLYQSDKIEANGIQPEMANAQLISLIETVLKSYALRASEKNIILYRHIEDETAMVRVDAYLFSQVIDNLVSNAIKYSPIDSTVLIKTECLDGWHHISVEDQGVGILPEEMPQLFQKFKQLSGKPTGGEHSTGLGLYVSKLTVELMGGEIIAESLGRDKGATFTIKFPAV